MEIFNPLPALLCTVVAYITAAFIGRWSSVESQASRFVPLDGLRGYMAFFVFLHHAAIWAFYPYQGWLGIPSAIYMQLGQTSVIFFFMITSFLFWSKLLQAKAKGINWTHLYISRIFRLVPLYFFSLVLICSLVFYLTDFHFQDSPAKVLLQIAKWGTFTIAGSPDINGYRGTGIIDAWVTWSLPYEWLFYLALPLCGILFSLRVPLQYLVASVIGLAIIYWRLSPSIFFIVAFGGGVLAAYMVRWSKAKTIFTSNAFSVVCLLLIIAAVYTRQLNDWLYLLLCSLAFSIIACGNRLFGFLTSKPSLILGEMGYSIYLLHGVLLFITFKMIFGIDAISRFSSWQHWGVVLFLTPVLVLFCRCTYLFIEKKGIEASASYVRKTKKAVIQSDVRSAP